MFTHHVRPQPVPLPDAEDTYRLAAALVGERLAALRAEAITVDRLGAANDQVEPPEGPNPREAERIMLHAAELGAHQTRLKMMGALAKHGVGPESA